MGPAACVALAIAPDLDILWGSHRGASHSLGAAAAVWLVAALAAVALRAPVFRTATVCAAAVASHILLDWLGRDTSTPFGIQALWPFSRHYFESGANVFLEISRRYWKPDEFIWGNLRSVAREVAILGPLAAVAWWLRTRGRSPTSS